MANPTGRTIEGVGYFVVVVLLGATFALLHFHGPGWAVNLALSGVFVVGLPTMFLSIRRELRGD